MYFGIFGLGLVAAGLGFYCYTAHVNTPTPDLKSTTLKGLSFSIKAEAGEYGCKRMVGTISGDMLKGGAAPASASAADLQVHIGKAGVELTSKTGNLLFSGQYIDRGSAFDGYVELEDNLKNVLSALGTQRTIPLPAAR